MDLNIMFDKDMGITLIAIVLILQVLIIVLL